MAFKILVSARGPLVLGFGVLGPGLDKKQSIVCCWSVHLHTHDRHDTRDGFSFINILKIKQRFRSRLIVNSRSGRWLGLYDAHLKSVAYQLLSSDNKQILRYRDKNL